MDGDDDDDDDDEGDEDEVFALKGLPAGSDEEDESEEEAEPVDTRADDRSKRSKKERKSKGKNKAKTSPPSSGAEDEEDEEEEGWGKTKSAYYSSNAGQIESDDEEANELEEQEAKRLQTKARDALTDDDFGLGDPLESPADADECVYFITSCVRTTNAVQRAPECPSSCYPPSSIGQAIVTSSPREEQPRSTSPCSRLG